MTASLTGSLSIGVSNTKGSQNGLQRHHSWVNWNFQLTQFLKRVHVIIIISTLDSPILRASPLQLDFPMLRVSA